MNVMEMLQKQFQDSASSLQTVQREYSKMLTDRQTLDSQLNENRQVRPGQGYLARGRRTLKTKFVHSFVLLIYLHKCHISFLEKQ